MPHMVLFFSLGSYNQGKRMHYWQKIIFVVLCIPFAGQAHMSTFNFDSPFSACSFKCSLDTCMQIASELKACEYEQRYHHGYPSQEFYRFVEDLLMEFSYNVAAIEQENVYRDDILYLERLYKRMHAYYDTIFDTTIFDTMSSKSIFNTIDTFFQKLLTQEQQLPLMCPQV